MKLEIISINGKYCSNPETHILGSLPCCSGIWINIDMVDKKDCYEELYGNPKYWKVEEK